MLESLDLYKQLPNKPAQPHQKRSIIGGKSVKHFEFGIAAPMLAAQMGRDRKQKLRRDWESVKVS
ncbi:hypothetical protein [Chamaesiphon sp. GL140_3_metabinner_50]|uniref:hypothetical protein n=1 Tax=Chamaesiphon sp. GL140_3_metabinner_50 TaxID=2970812 RepID=UPI0025D7B8DD|nr:hypothetical protein [Chamaesiphon sp. GL140_3_metabinner_50]